MPNLKSLLPDFIKKSLWPSPAHKAAKEFGLFMRGRGYFSNFKEEVRQAYSSDIQNTFLPANPMGGPAIFFKTIKAEVLGNVLRDIRRNIGKKIEMRDGDVCSPNICIPMESYTVEKKSVIIDFPEDVKNEIAKLVEKYRVHYALLTQIAIGEKCMSVDEFPPTFSAEKQWYSNQACSKIFFSSQEELLRNLDKAA